MPYAFEPRARAIPGKRDQEDRLGHYRNRPDPPWEAPELPVEHEADQRERELEPDHHEDCRRRLPARLGHLLGKRAALGGFHQSDSAPTWRPTVLLEALQRRARPVSPSPSGSTRWSMQRLRTEPSGCARRPIRATRRGSRVAGGRAPG